MTDGVLRESAEFYYEVNELWDDEDLDPDDHVAVLVRNFTSSDCDDFAYVLNRITGWQVVTAGWTVPNWGYGHHTMVRSPEGRLLDASGWITEDDLRCRYLRSARKATFTLSDTAPSTSAVDGHESFVRVLNVVRHLPHAPFQDTEFMVLSHADVVDEAFPEPDREGAILAPGP